MLRHTSIEEQLPPQSVDDLRRKVAWQVAIAYGLPLEAAEDPAPTPVLEPASPAPELPPAAAGRFTLPTLTQLEGLVAAAADAKPDRMEEWQWYLFYLRDFAKSDGSLDDTFSLLVETAFGELLETEPRIH